MAFPTLTLPSTASSIDLYATLRKILVDFVDVDSATLATILGSADQVWTRAPKQPPVFPYLTLLLDRDTTAGFNGYRETARLEVQVIGKPESQLLLTERALDLVDRCMLSLLYTSDGLMTCRSRQRQTLPPFTAPAEVGTVGARGTYDLLLWTRSLTRRRSS